MVAVQLWVELASQEVMEVGAGGGCSYLCGFPWIDGEQEGQKKQERLRGPWARLWLDTVQRRRARPRARWAPPHSYQHLEKHLGLQTSVTAKTSQESDRKQVTDI